MNSLVWTSTVAFAASLLLTAAVRALRGATTSSIAPTANASCTAGRCRCWGGVAVYAATVLGLLAVRLGAGGTPEFVELSNAWIIAAGFVCLVGGIDDRFNLPSRIKLAAANRLGAADRHAGLLRRSHRGVRLPDRAGMARHSADDPLVGRLHQRPEPDRRHGRPGLDHRPFDRRHAGRDRRQPRARSRGRHGHRSGRFAGGIPHLQSPAGQHLSRRLRQHGDRTVGRPAGHARVAEDLGHLGDYRPRRGNDPADVRHRRGDRAAHTDRPPIRHARSAAHSPPAARSRLEPVASPLPAGGVVPDDWAPRPRPPRSSASTPWPGSPPCRWSC